MLIKFFSSSFQNFTSQSLFKKLSKDIQTKISKIFIKSVKNTKSGDFLNTKKQEYSINKKNITKNFSHINSNKKFSSTIKNKNQKDLAITKSLQGIKDSLKDIKEKENKHFNLSGSIVINNFEQILLYYSKVPLTNVLHFHIPKILTLFGIFWFLKTNPLYLSFPAGMPLMAFFGMYYVLRYVTKMKYRKHIINEIWLDKNGLELIVKYRNIRYRKARSEEAIMTIPIKAIYPSTMKKNGGMNHKVWSEDVFPATHDLFLKSYTHNCFNYWVKTYSINKKMIQIYKYPIYAKFDALIDIFNSKKVVIDAENSKFFLMNVEDSKFEDVEKALSDMNIETNFDIQKFLKTQNDVAREKRIAYMKGGKTSKLKSKQPIKLDRVNYQLKEQLEKDKISEQIQKDEIKEQLDKNKIIDQIEKDKIKKQLEKDIINDQIEKDEIKNYKINNLINDKI